MEKLLLVMLSKEKSDVNANGKQNLPKTVKICGIDSTSDWPLNGCPGKMLCISLYTKSNYSKHFTPFLFICSLKLTLVYWK
jgi:hypothetical protein